MSPQVAQSPLPSSRAWQCAQWTSNAPCGRNRSRPLASATSAAISAIDLTGREHDGLLLEVAVEGLEPVLLAEPGLLRAAEGQLVVRDLDVVHPGVAGLDELDRLAGL